MGVRGVVRAARGATSEATSTSAGGGSGEDSDSTTGAGGTGTCTGPYNLVGPGYGINTYTTNWSISAAANKARETISILLLIPRARLTTINSEVRWAGPS